MKKTITSLLLVAVALSGCSDRKIKNPLSTASAVDSILITETASLEGREVEQPTKVTEIATPADTFSYKGYQMLADILAGKTPADASFLSSVTGKKSFSTHCAEMTTKWDAYKKGKVDHIRAWSKENLTSPVDTLFYPFGGPDFNYMASFFPDVKYSVLIGIEKPGKIPFVGKQNSDELLAALRESIRSNMRSSFFVTKNMAEDLDCELQGTLPVVLMFISLHGYEVITVNPIELTDEGEIKYSDPDNVYAHTLNKQLDKGFEVMYRLPGEKGARKLNYLSTDLSNHGFKKKSLDRLIADKFSGKTTFLKAASYLLNDRSFSSIKKAILDNSGRIVTGPSGMPYAALKKGGWDITLYGKWAAPIKDFSNFEQLDLKEAYSKAPSRPINFRYDYGSGSGFLVASKKKQT